MLSMTGFGAGEAPFGDGRVCVELRALNHRFLDVRVRPSNELADYGFFIEQLTREYFHRGRLDVALRLEGASLLPVQFSIERARKLYENLCELRDAVLPGSPVPLTTLAAFPNLITVARSGDAEQVQTALRAAFQHALTHLNTMRASEGSALRNELVARLRAVQELRREVATRATCLVDSVRERLRERAARIIAETGLLPERGRLEAELALLAERGDITEELVRLDSHFEQFSRLLESSTPVGRRMDFLLQEIGREANTIGAKGQDASIAYLVVELKAELERIREQVQNVE